LSETRRLQENLENELLKDGVIKGSIRDFEKYFLKLAEQKQKEVDKKLKDNKRIELARRFQNIKDDNDFVSLRLLHNYLKKHNLYNFSEEALRRLLKEI
jgi:hypothetical protein